MARFRAAHLARVVLTCAGMAAGATSNAGSPELRASLLGAATEAAASLAPPRERSEAYFALARARVQPDRRASATRALLTCLSCWCYLGVEPMVL